MQNAKVIVDPQKRRERVRDEVERAGAPLGKPRLRDALLDEIANLVEWPAAIACTFDREFLDVPQEALIQTMETNQKFVPVFDANGKLTEHFIGIANIESKDPAEIRKGYERVIRPRFADAKFFYDEDRKTPLASHQDALKSVTYQQQLGSVWDKSVRVAELSRVIANRLGVDAAKATRAASLSKCDLVTRMVGEFPELQGVMGRYYATASGEDAGIAQALDEFYRPRFAGDDIAQGDIARVLAVAERLDTLAGIFAVGMKPSGNKDPFALRRAALGLGRTLIEGNLDLDLEALLREAIELLPAIPSKKKEARKIAGRIETGADAGTARFRARTSARLLRRERHRRRSVRCGARRRAGIAHRFRRAPACRRRFRRAARRRRARRGEQAHRQYSASGRRSGRREGRYRAARCRRRTRSARADRKRAAHHRAADRKAPATSIRCARSPRCARRSMRSSMA